MKIVIRHRTAKPSTIASSYDKKVTVFQISYHWKLFHYFTISFNDNKTQLMSLESVEFVNYSSNECQYRNRKNWCTEQMNILLLSSVDSSKKMIRVFYRLCGKNGNLNDRQYFNVYHSRAKLFQPVLYPNQSALLCFSIKRVPRYV